MRMIVIAWLSMKKSGELICFGRLQVSHPRLVITFLVSQPLLQFNQFRMIAILSLDYYPTQCVIICFSLSCLPFSLMAWNTHTLAEILIAPLWLCVYVNVKVCVRPVNVLSTPYLGNWNFAIEVPPPPPPPPPPVNPKKSEGKKGRKANTNKQPTKSVISESGSTKLLLLMLLMLLCEMSPQAVQAIKCTRLCLDGAFCPLSLFLSSLALITVCWLAGQFTRWNSNSNNSDKRFTANKLPHWSAQRNTGAVCQCAS